MSMPLTLVEVKNSITNRSLHFYGYEHLIQAIEDGRKPIKVIYHSKEFQSYWGVLFRLLIRKDNFDSQILVTPMSDLTNKETKREKLPVEFLSWVASLIEYRYDEHLNTKSAVELYDQLSKVEKTVILLTEEVTWKPINN